jgi:Leucine rich repeat
MPISPEAQALIQLVASKNEDSIRLALTLQDSLQSADFEQFVSLCAYFNNGEDLRKLFAHPKPIFKCPDLSATMLKVNNYPKPLHNLNAHLTQFENYTCLELSDMPTQTVSQATLFGQGFKRLESLMMCLNDLYDVPLALCELSNLRKLSLSQNYLSQLPAEIARLTALHDLDLCNNWLFKLPDDFAKLQQLETLELSGNHFEHFPPQIGEISRLKRLFLAKNGLPMCLSTPYANKRNAQEREGARTWFYSEFLVQLLDKKTTKRRKYYPICRNPKYSWKVRLFCTRKAKIGTRLFTR